MIKKYLFSSESVTEGHPDKMADQISDAILDDILRQDPTGRVACETYLTTGMALVGGEISTKAYVDVQKVVRDMVKHIGYDDSQMGFDYKSVAVMNTIHEQSADIAQGVVKATLEEQGAGDQGLMFGYATNETKELMPLPITLAHGLTRKLATTRKSGKINWLRPDGKSQVTVEYENGKPLRVEAVIIAAQHDAEVEYDEIKGTIIDNVVKPVCGDLLDEKTKFLINGTGRFVIGGPHGDTGLTGRKIIVDTYGGVGSHGGGCFSGKDPSKVDRSASYMARLMAKSVVNSNLADKCEIQLAYCIGVPEPVSVNIVCMGTEIEKEEVILDKIRKEFDLRPRLIIERLDLLRPIYRQTAAYGHFGREESDFTWEKPVDLK
ncbi:MAG: methionine adenosyltransferase [Candidatus Hodarchaeales archaeon]|jgi:S-adenosylmethionine synthetase